VRTLSAKEAQTRSSAGAWAAGRLSFRSREFGRRAIGLALLVR